MDDKIYTANDLLEQKCMARPTLESKTEYLATINQMFEQDNSYVFQITYDDGKYKVLTSIDLISLLFKKILLKDLNEKMQGKFADILQKISKIRKGNPKNKRIIQEGNQLKKYMRQLQKVIRREQKKKLYRIISIVKRIYLKCLNQ